MTTPTPPAADGPPVWLMYITVDDAAEWVGIDPGESNFDLICQMACDWVQSFLDRPVTPTPMVRRFDTTGASICLPYTPVVSITSVSEYTGSIARVLTETTPEAQVDGWQLDYATGILTRVNGLYSKPWLPGSRNIEVSWVAGYATTPARIKLATYELVKHWWENAQENSSVGVGSSVDADNYGPQSDAGMWAGVPYRVESMLQSTNRIGIG